MKIKNLLLLAPALAPVLWADVPVIPRPVSEKSLQGGDLSNYAQLITDATQSISLSAASSIECPASLDNEKKHLQTLLKSMPKGKGGSVKLALDKNLAPEGYRMTVNASGVNIEGGSAAGVFYGIQSLRQMLIIGKEKGNTNIPHMVIEDAPACEWRGIMIDSARHFQTKEEILRFIDAMAAYKLNRMHWHIVDSEGWRLEIKKYPKLVEVCQDFPAEYPSEDPTVKSRPAKYMYGHFHGGGYYTQKDIREIVAYAKSRHIEIMPEIAFPAHAMAALTAYPEFSTTRKVPTVRTNISPDLFAVNDKSIEFLKDILDETMALFPFEVIHFGGDEAPKGQWKNCPEAQERIQENCLSDEDELQAWLFNQLAEHIKKQGRRPAGWEEIMHGNNFNTLTKSAIVYPWLSTANAIKSANEGHGVVHCTVGPLYLDSVQTHSPADNWSLYGGPFTLENIYKFNLYPGDLTEKGRKNILGAQGQCWSELMPRAEHMEYQAWPRATALAEMTWTNQERKDYEDYYARLVQHTVILDAHKLNYRYINPLPVAQWSAEEMTKASFKLALTPESIRDAEGEMMVEFNYRSGYYGLEIAKVELLKDGKVIAEDEHDGVTGHQNTNNFYRLKYSGKLTGKVELRITHKNADGKHDSKGNVTVFTGEKAMALFNPRNFRGSDHPAASWTKSETKRAAYSLRIGFDGVVKVAGNYELVFRGTDLKQPVELTDFAFVSTASGGGNTAIENRTLKMTPKRPLAIYPLKLTKDHIKPGNSINVVLKQSEAYDGEVRILPTASMKDLKWTPELLGEGGTVIAYAHKVEAKQDGSIKLRFRYTGGGNGLDIKHVMLMNKGEIIADDKHEGFVGHNPRNNEYTLSSSKIKAGSSYTIRLVIAGSGGADSNGVVEVH